MSVTKMLTGHYFFSQFPPEEVDAISRFTSDRTIEKGDVICGIGQKATHAFILLDGEVELRLPSGSGEMGLMVSRVGRGEFFGLSAMLNHEHYTASAVGSKPSRVLFIESGPLMEMLNKSPLVGLKLMSIVARAYFDRYQKLIERVQKALTDLAVEA